MQHKAYCSVAAMGSTSRRDGGTGLPLNHCKEVHDLSIVGNGGQLSPTRKGGSRFSHQTVSLGEGKAKI